MVAPAPTAFVQGQGSVGADNLNTFLQSCLSVAQLRTVIGVPGNSIEIYGTVTPNDGGQGFFYWNATGIAADDNGVTTVVPTGVTLGCWTRILLFTPFNSQFPRYYTANFTYRDISLLPLATVIGRACSVLNWKYPSTANGGIVAGQVDTAPTAQTDFLFLRDGMTIATLRWTSGAVKPQFISAADAPFAKLIDYLDLQTPASFNGMAGVFAVTSIGLITLP